MTALPAEARSTLALIDRGGPFPYAKDGTVFGNFERELPGHTRGYYHESYGVITGNRICAVQGLHVARSRWCGSNLGRSSMTIT
ncbi:ribonuclease domain-containing protein [Streptomyces sp. NPDC059618]|uniref:ribonuclease domain-containing protein n=1 Tax=Streptomyces sp. NPDC059618 TaxID=3346887 RepID=UPI0036C6D576